MERFLGLSIQKQNEIINAALDAFGSNGYKKASIRDIAHAAGISKSMMFHYFGTKKALYIFLAEYSIKTLINTVKEQFNENETDFFERIRAATEIEVTVMIKHPAILSFLKSLYLETDEEVAEQVKEMMILGEAFRGYIALDKIDVFKFKEGIDPALVSKMLTWFAEGYVGQLGQKAKMDVKELNSEFLLCLDMLKQNFYKGEYL